MRSLGANNSSPMQDFRNLDAWHKAHELSLDVHQTLVRHRRIDAHMRSQMSRAARSIPSNLVEGCGKDSQAELARYADMSIASSSELEYWVLSARDVGYFRSEDYERLTANTIEVRKMLYGLRKAIRNTLLPKPYIPPSNSTPI
jgi:four helix bundle protein